MVRGRVGFRLDWREENARLGERLDVPAGMAYDWWNAGDDEAHVVVELRADAPRLERFEMMISMLYGMARDGKTDAKGRPNLSCRTRSSPESLMTSSASSSRRASCRRSCSARSCPWRTSCVLGFAVTAYGPNHGLPGAAFLAARGYHHIGLNTWTSEGGDSPSPRHAGLHHLAIVYPNRRELAYAVRSLFDHGHPIEGPEDHGATGSVYLSDPDSNGIELYYARPREERFDPPGNPILKGESFDLQELLAER
jgi:catechol 2,3-dioxygenase